MPFCHWDAILKIYRYTKKIDSCFQFWFFKEELEKGDILMLKLVVDFHLLCSYTKIHKSGFRYSVITGVFQTRALPFFPSGKHILWRLPQVLAASFLNLDRWTWDKPHVSLEQSTFLASVCAIEMYCMYAGHYLIRNNESSVNALNLRQIQVSVVYVVNTTPGWVLAIKTQI